ncbi:MAG: ATP-binding cassette domain-containing protein, partial [Clostridia bacterium]|nr:ATP-binding cassette domain-containing protein [Clostridia bacterium]
MALLQIQNLNFLYPDGSQKALDDLSLSLEEGSFTLLVGESGSGKTTLLRLIKREIAPFGEQSGNILYDGAPSTETPFWKIGFVGQNPDEQIVTDRVWHELAYGAENRGLSTEEIRLRVGETVAYFGMEGWYHKRTDELSGGQKQLLNLASVMVLHPQLLLLDEPTGQLDPIAAANFIATLQKLNRELGVTILMTEHRLEEVFPVSETVAVLRQGKLLWKGTPRQVCEELKGDRLFAGFPSAARIWNGLHSSAPCPLTVREGRRFLQEQFPKTSGKIVSSAKDFGKPVLEAHNVWFRYERNAPDVIRDMSFSVGKGEIFSILGGNGSGKTTTLNLLAGVLSPMRGKCLVDGKATGRKENAEIRRRIAVLPQNPQTLFLRNTIREDFEDYLSLLGKGKTVGAALIDRVTEDFGLAALLDRHPYDVSGGEQQLAAFAKILLSEPDIILMDEPT